MYLYKVATTLQYKYYIWNNIPAVVHLKNKTEKKKLYMIVFERGGTY